MMRGQLGDFTLLQGRHANVGSLNITPAVRDSPLLHAHHTEQSDISFSHASRLGEKHHAGFKIANKSYTRRRSR